MVVATLKTAPVTDAGLAAPFASGKRGTFTPAAGDMSEVKLGREEEEKWCWNCSGALHIYLWTRV